MEKAVDRIVKALRQNEKILIYGDYDVDGITSTSILYDFFRRQNADVCYYIPDRLNEGYGHFNGCRRKNAGDGRGSGDYC